MAEVWVLEPGLVTLSLQVYIKYNKNKYGETRRRITKNR